MKSIHRIAVGGLLWLAFCAAASATTLTVEQNNFSTAGDGGGFSAYLNNNSQNPFEVFCVDYANYVDPPQTYSVNIDVVGVTVADTRYGTTPTPDFVAQVTAPSSSTVLGAQARYALAGWLITQYNLNPGTTAQQDQDSGIQMAIWTLLNTNSGRSFTSTDESTWLNNALAWYGNESPTALLAFEDTVTVYSSTDIDSATSLDSRWSSGPQEMISVSGTPEPAAMALVGAGLLGLGLIRRRKTA